jgi:hypothetical protein
MAYLVEHLYFGVGFLYPFALMPRREELRMNEDLVKIGYRFLSLSIVKRF